MHASSRSIADTFACMHLIRANGAERHEQRVRMIDMHALYQIFNFSNSPSRIT
jgi:hypothetical protein